MRRSIPSRYRRGYPGTPLAHRSTGFCGPLHRDCWNVLRSVRRPCPPPSRPHDRFGYGVPVKPILLGRQSGPGLNHPLITVRCRLVGCSYAGGYLRFREMRLNLGHPR